MKNNISDIIKQVEGWDLNDLERLQSELESIVDTKEEVYLENN